jgi:hypothetical protein
LLSVIVGSSRSCQPSQWRDQGAAGVSRLWIKCWPDRTGRSRVHSTRENRRFSKWKKVMDDFFHGQLAPRIGWWSGAAAFERFGRCFAETRGVFA